MIDMRKLSFGGPAAIVASMALIVGLDAATATKTAIVTSLLIVGVADNLTDSLSVHIYQEAERLEQRQALRTTAANFVTRFAVSLSFVGLFLLARGRAGLLLCVGWGFLLLATLTHRLAKLRGVSPAREIVIHSAVAVVVIGLSKLIGGALPVLVAALH
jgi:VIT1/CCC1 family predicted Fe2+/Mn2+ transporter